MDKRDLRMIFLLGSMFWIGTIFDRMVISADNVFMLVIEISGLTIFVGSIIYLNTKIK